MKKNKGFTLVELLVSLFVFSSLIVIMSGIFVSVIKVQRKAFALQNTQESARYILESMAKEVRMSVVNTDAGNGPILNITNPEDDTFNYEFDNGNKTISRWGQIVSPNNLEITGNFYVRKTGLPTPTRALVTIVIKIKTKEASAEGQEEVNLQASISARSF